MQTTDKKDCVIRELLGNKYGEVGTARSYIARVEKGETDIRISSFFRIARALGIEFTPTFL